MNDDTTFPSSANMLKNRKHVTAPKYFSENNNNNTNSNSMISYLRTLTTWHCPHSPLLQQSIDISRRPGTQQQTCSSVFAAVGPC